MPVYRANCVVRDRAGREVLARYPLWSGEAADPAAAVDAARARLLPLVVADERADTAVLNMQGADGKKFTATEYAEDLRAGRYVSGDLSTLLFDRAAQIGEQAVKAELDALKRRALEAMPDVVQKAKDERVRRGMDALHDVEQRLKNKATVAADPVQDFFGDAHKCRSKQEDFKQEYLRGEWPAISDEEMMQHEANLASRGTFPRPATAEDMERFGLKGVSPDGYEVDRHRPVDRGPHPFSSWGSEKLVQHRGQRTVVEAGRRAGMTNLSAQHAAEVQRRAQIGQEVYADKTGTLSMQNPDGTWTEIGRLEGFSIRSEPKLRPTTQKKSIFEELLTAKMFPSSDDHIDISYINSEIGKLENFKKEKS